MTQTTFFNTSNHTTEMFVPQHQFSRSGFEFDVATVARKQIALELWTIAEAWGYEDMIMAMQDSAIDGLTSPKKFDDVTDLDEYLAVFTPGGHGPVIDPNPPFGAFAGCDHDSLCQGTNTLRSAALERKIFLAQRLQDPRAPGQR